jgi:hypothetical protein
MLDEKKLSKEIRSKIKRVTPLRRPPRLDARRAKFGIKPIHKKGKK